MPLPGIDLAALQAEYNRFYTNHGQNMSSLRDKTLVATDTQTFFDDSRVITDDMTEMGFFEQDVHIQQWQPKFTPSNNIKLEVERAVVTRQKIDMECVPDLIISSWYGFLAGEKKNPVEYPFVRWWLELGIASFIKNFEEFEVYKGVKGAIVAGTATVKGAATNGVEKIIKDGILAGKVTPYITGLPPVAGSAGASLQYVEWIEDWWYSIDYRIRKELKGEILVDSLRMDMYEEGRQQKYDKTINLMGADASENGLHTVGRTGKQKLKFVDSMNGKNRLVTTRKDNAFRITRRPPISGFRLLPEEYLNIRATTDRFEGIGFWYLPWVITNNVD